MFNLPLMAVQTAQTLSSPSLPFVPLVLLGSLCLVIGYLLGGINTAIIVSKIAYKDDIRNYGSKNAGMTNVMRTYGKSAALITILGDILKTVIAVFAGKVIMTAFAGAYSDDAAFISMIGEMGAYIGGLGTVLGHVFPCYFGFRGGKGVATVAAMILCTNPLCFLILFAVFAILVIGYKYISLGSVMCMFLYPLIISRLQVLNIVTMPCVFAVAILIIVKHKDNIKRLLNGTESKFAFKKSKKTADTKSESKENDQ